MIQLLERHSEMLPSQHVLNALGNDAVASTLRVIPVRNPSPRTGRACETASATEVSD